MQPLEPVLRRMTPEDVPQIREMYPKIGWNHSSSQLRANITWAGAGSFCLELAGKLLGTANVISYGADLAWIGMVVTDPDYQRRGFARRLMRAAMDYCEINGIKTIMLDASELGYGLYESLGFRPLYRIETWTGLPQNISPPDNIRPMTVADLSSVVALDTRLFGLPRPQMLRWLQGFGGWVAVTNGLLNGYVFAPAGESNRVGPWYHHNPQGADALLQAALSSFAGQTSVRLDIPETNDYARALAGRYGLSTQRGCVRMLWGETPPPGKMTEQYAIISFATG
jgi:GNAT superfamily N-acetyltransferase